MYMAEKSRTITSQVLGLAGPSILANITVPLVGMVDLVFNIRRRLDAKQR